jgi:N-acetyl-anhydromuramyl-L-alanine amidase AmpD
MIVRFLFNLVKLFFLVEEENEKMNTEEIKTKEAPMIKAAPIEPLKIKEAPVVVKEDTFEIQKRFLKPDQYVRATTEKTGIVLHHTVGGSADSTFRYWNESKDRVATHYLIDRDGSTFQCLPLENWAFHIYIKSPGNKIPQKYKNLGQEYDKRLIGIELCSFGPVTARNGRFYTIYNKEIDKSKVIKKSYRGYDYWEDYTDEQIEALRLLLLFLLDKYPIFAQALKEDYSDIFNINQQALDLKPGIYSHGSLRTDKSDCVPSPKLLAMLNNLKA